MSPTNQIETVGGRYRLGERLGHGGMGEVFAAHDLRLDREVALKLLREDLAEQDGMRERVVAEARLAARLTHPHVVGVLDTGEQDGRPFVVMERLSGRTLRDELTDGRMPAERVRDVGLQVLRALAAAHDLGIVHRDVKPGNVLDAGVGTWKVADFGIAKWVHADETLTGTGELLGSPSYLAPERIEGHQAGPASDLYAVGVLLYEALCGRKPFEGDDPFALATAIRDGVFEPPASVLPDADPGIVAVIETAMRLDPAERYESAEHMAAALLGEVAPASGDTTTTMATQRSDDTTATMVAPEPRPLPRTDLESNRPQPVPGGTETMPVPRMGRTARLPYQSPAPRPSRPRPHPKTALIVAGAVLAVVVVTVLALAAFTGPDARGGNDVGSPGSGAGRSSLPAPLEDALTRLEESVQP
ncbi:MAG: serine/threonine protein kinase [Actinomycetota bacterium]|nr:serine/threonine protein kinase [Actinomycetota bacterium]